MSLSSHIRDPESPVRQFMERHFPATRAVTGPANRALRGAETIRPSGEVIPWSTLGMALDYRCRYFFGTTPSRRLVAWQGAARVSAEPLPIALRDNAWVEIGAPEDAPSLPGSAIEAFFADLDDALARLEPSGRELSQEDERLLNRYCFVLALFETAYRSPLLRRDSPLFSHGDPTPADLLGLADPSWIDDLCALARRFARELGREPVEKAVLNPVFEGSGDVGGADADLILDHLLVDLKSTVTPRIEKRGLHQMLGYVLLDYNDAFGIRSAGFYLARQGMLVEWEIDDLAGRLSAGRVRSITDLRRDFRETIRAI